MPPAKRGIAMVFQTYALYPHLNVRNNMALGLKQAGAPAELIDKRIAASSAMLSLEPYLERRPAELSGGQRQRVAIGRALVREPKLFLFDEPLSNLDAALRVNTRLEIAKLHHELKATMVYVTHDQVEAMTLADKIVVLNEGRIEQVGAPMQLYNSPANEFVAGFIGSPKMNFIPGERLNDRARTVGVRPEHISVSHSGRRLEGHGHPCRASRRRHQPLSRHREGRPHHRPHFWRLRCRGRARRCSPRLIRRKCTASTRWKDDGVKDTRFAPPLAYQSPYGTQTFFTSMARRRK